MANKPSTTAGSTTASPPASAAAPAAPASAPVKASTVAGARGPVIPPETPTELQRGVDAFADVFEGLAGGSPEPEEKPSKASAERRDTKPEPKESASAEQPDPIAQDDDKPSDEEDESILGNDTEPGDEDEDDAGEGKDAKGYEEKLFKAREKRRQLETELKTEREQREALQKKVEELASAKAPAAVKLDGAFVNVQSAEQIPQVTQWLEDRMEMVEDFLDSQDDSFIETIDGKEVERDRAWAKAHKQWLRTEQRRASSIEQSLRSAEQLVTTAEQTARKKYPFVFDPQSRHNAVVLDLVKEDPSLNSLPSKPLALGRMALGKMIEDAAPDVRRQISALLSGKAAKPAATVAPAPAPSKPAAKSVPSPASSAPRQRAAAAEEPEPDDTRRLINGDRRAAEEWAAGLLG